MELNPDPHLDALRDHLLAAIMNERGLLAELRRALATQRASVTRGDPDTLDAASQAVSRAILTLDEARRSREQMMQLANDTRPHAAAGGPAPDGALAAVAESRQALRTEAEATVRELAETQELLRAAMRAGDAYLQALFDSVSTTTTAQPYGSPAGSPAAAPSSLLLNRRA